MRLKYSGFFFFILFGICLADSKIDYTKPIGVAGHDPDAKEPKAINRLSSKYTEAWLREHIKEPAQWVSYPTLKKRSEWNLIDDETKKTILAEANEYKTKAWLPLTASISLEYLRTGNRAHYSSIASDRQNRLQGFVLAELVENKGKYLDSIADAIWMISEESFWGIPVHLSQIQRTGNGLPNVEEPTIELFSAERSAALSWTYYLIGDRLDHVSPFLRQRIEYEVNRRILTPFLNRNDFWWMGRAERKDLNNWTPWIISNVITSALLVEKDTNRRAEIIFKCIQILDRYLDGCLPDGGCDEGASYWNEAAAATFDCLALLEGATSGDINIFNDSLIRNMGHFICTSHVSGPWALNFSDCSALTKPNPVLLYRYGMKTQDVSMQEYGSWLAKREAKGINFHSSFSRALPSLFNYEKLKLIPAREPLERDNALPNLDLYTARDQAGSASGLYFAMRGYFNAKSHNHNDAASFMIYANGAPVFIDPGVESYTAKTFSSERYTLWTMQSAYHNLPTINGYMQEHGRQYAAQVLNYEQDDKHALIKMDLSKAYPKEAHVLSWNRTLELVRKDKLIITEEYHLSKVDSSVVLNLMTAGAVELKEPGRFIIQAGTVNYPGGKVSVKYDSTRLRVRIEDIPIQNGDLRGVWGDKLTRIQLIDDHNSLSGLYTIECREL